MSTLATTANLTEQCQWLRQQLDRANARCEELLQQNTHQAVAITSLENRLAEAKNCQESK